MSDIGLVSLVGAGPGDPELMTLKGLRRLREADAVVYDRLVCRELLEECRPGAELYDAGKAPGTGRHGAGQEATNRLLVTLARQGKSVVRLKGGDPYVFGRGGEEALALVRAGVRFEVVPGVSSALAAPAAVGIPVTHRGIARSVTIATGHDSRDGDGGHDWEALARSGGTLVFLMPVEHLESIAARLLEHGRSPAEPAALVRWATTPEQEVVFAPLSGIAEAAARASLRPPATLVVGPTVALAEVIAHGPVVLAGVPG